MRTVNIQDAKTQLSRLLREVEAGQSIAIARAGRVIAHLVRPAEPTGRQFGGFAGDVTWDDDAFAPLDDAAAAAFDESALEPEVAR
ncbi:MAG: type II toxin-antitoxin system Phd/YefM family antitoxin [Deltaproteobacteria bacterium]|nr:type II toxin-antitoxin system Phd/YefM family antitoxin [Deltaproteobacteria bacterium]